MIIVYKVIVCILLLLCNLFDLNATTPINTNNDLLRIVYVMTTISASCGPFNDHFKQVLLQAIASQHNSEVILLSNFKQCRWSLHDLRNGEVMELRNISIIESHAIKSSRTLEFERLLKKLVPKGHESDLTLTSLYRYFMLEDYMTNHTIKEVLHMDNDVMIYEDLHQYLPILRSSYPRLAAVASIHKRFISSSTLWIGQLQAINHFNTFLLGLGRQSGEFNQYTSWLREFACCRSVEQGGIFPDEQGRGVKAWALQDMTMLAYYHHLHKNELRLFPSLPKLDLEYKHLSPDSNMHKVFVHPATSNDTTSSSTSLSSLSSLSSSSLSSTRPGNHNSNYRHNKHIAIVKEHHTNISLYAIGGSEVGSDLNGSLFDSTKGGWGDHFHNIVVGVGNSREAHAVASRHIIEQAILRYNCSITFKCALPSSSSSSSCYTKPFVSCGNDRETSLLTMHAFKSNPSQYRSMKCDCH